jgi:soluble lytic murein transglycosylase-like protein
MKIYNDFSSPHSRSTFARVLSKTHAFVFGVILLAPAFAIGGELKTNERPNAETAAPASSNAGPQASTAKPQPSAPNQQKQQASTNPTPPQSGSSNSADDYKNSLKALVSLYELDAQRLTQENSRLKELYTEGLVARMEVDASDKSLADARAKVEAAQKQIAEASLRPDTSQSVDVSEGSAQLWTTGSNKIDNLIRYYGKDAGVDPYLIFCLMSQESKFALHATSPKGAQGLMQLMPATAARYGVSNPYDSAQGIMGGVHYLKDLLQLFGGRLDLALAGYSAGENAVIKHGYKIPPYAETKSYVRLISARYAKNNRAVSTRK